MNFIEAVKAMQDGKKVRSPHWVRYYYVRKQSHRYIAFDGKSEFNWNFSENEMLSKDWEIYQEEPKLHTFEEALAALKRGKTIYRKSYHDKCGANVSIWYEYDWFASVFNRDDVLANDWIIKEEGKNE